VSEKSLQNGANDGFLVPAKAVWHDRVFGLGTNAKKIASGGKSGYTGSQPKGKTEIPVNGSSLPFSPPPSVGIRTSFLE
jgi:hypothetical protein